MSTSPPPVRALRASYQRTPTGLCVSEIAHPLLVGRRLRLSAPSPCELAEDKAIIEGWAREYRRSALSLEQFRNRLSRFETARAQVIPLRDAWTRHFELARPEHRPKLRTIWKCQLNPQLGDLSITEVTSRRLSLWEATQIAEDYAPTTVQSTFMVLSAVVRGSLREDEDLPWKTNRGKYWKPSRAPVPRKESLACGTAEEAERLVQAALEDDRARRASVGYGDRLADLAPRTAVALFGGFRNGELAGLGWDDIVREADRVLVRIHRQATNRWRQHHPEWTRPLAPTKGRKQRTLILHPTAVLALDAQRELLEARGWYRADGPVFPGHEATPFAGQWRNNSCAIDPRDVKRIAAAAGLPFASEWVTHSLRHSLATIESTCGADLRSIQKRTGHGSLVVLERYIHAKTGRGLPPSAIPELGVHFDSSPHDTEPCPPPDSREAA
jgi:integrase